jgi:hypothetical protein
VNQYQAAINRGAASGYPPALLFQVVDLVKQLRREMKGVSQAQLDAEDEDAEEENESLTR